MFVEGKLERVGELNHTQLLKGGDAYVDLRTEDSQRVEKLKRRCKVKLRASRWMAGLLVTALLASLAVASIAPTPVEATVYPGGYIGSYIEYVDAVRDGMIIKLTSTGLSRGRSWDGASMLANWARDLYYRDGAGSFFSYRSVSDLAREIQLHCWGGNNPVNAGLWDRWWNLYGAWD
jgi:hypothetical protein